MAIRDELLTKAQPWISGAIQVGGWLTVGACIVVGRGRRSRPSGFMAVMLLFFLAIWYGQFFILGAPAKDDRYNWAYAAVNCIVPFVAGWYFPRALIGLFCGWLAVVSVALTVVLTALNLTIYPVAQVIRNQVFPSFNPISQAAVIGIGVLTMMYYRPPKALSIKRLILLMVSGAQILLTASRGPIIGLVSALLVAETMPAKAQRKRLWTVVVLGCLLGGVFLFKDYLPEDVLSRVFDVNQSINMRGDVGGASARIGPILLAIQLGMSRPVFGWGESANPIVGFYCHNFFAQAFLETGLIGLTAVTLVLITGGIRLVRWARLPTGEGRLILALFVLFLLVSQFAGTPVYAVQLWFLLGLAAAFTAAVRPRVGRGTRATVWPAAPNALPISSHQPTEQGGRIR